MNSYIAATVLSGCSRPPTIRQEGALLRRAFSLLSESYARPAKQCLYRRKTAATSHHVPKSQPPQKNQSRPLSTSRILAFRPSTRWAVLKPYKPKDLDQGLSFNDQAFAPNQLQKIYTDPIWQTPDLANRLLRVLHARRVDGTLDLDLADELLEKIQSPPVRHRRRALLAARERP